MKLKITSTKVKKDAKVLSFRDGTSNAEVLLTALYDGGVSETAIVALAKSLSATKEDVMSVCKRYTYEFVVACVMGKKYTVLDYLFDTLKVDVNHVSANGSPLMLYAIQTGYDSLCYFLKRHAILVHSGDLLHNSKDGLKHITATWCVVAGDTDTRNTILNLAFHVLSHINNYNTLVDLARFALKADYLYTSVCAILERMVNVGNQSGRGVPPDIALDFVKLLIAQKCGWDYRAMYEYVRKYLTDAHITECMYLAARGNSHAVYSVLWSTFQKHRIQ